ncbi:dynactin subunit 3 isoform X1 [Lynx canadensis]|uniref:dynactin subunit 3 isoform X3 n=1 Tax=Felis catus TaxID=9685 RepID=UPI0005ACA9DE|nr:dynactin subunit 3 isoform X3 [Felis catus]XP_030149741.1 dynactin subunit 3 isoform X1 [Lynx canadensis]XP_058551047.1 dynactin subunit 3 isoform X1 [Neofelis nebulosa]
MAAVSDVQRLQARVEELERWVYGSGGPRGSRKVADGLVKVQVALGNIASKRERVKILYKKIEDLIKYLDPEYIDRIAIPDASKLQFILAEEQFILSQIALLEQVEALVPMLDSAHIKGTSLEQRIHFQNLRQFGPKDTSPFLSMPPACSAWPRSTSSSRTSVWRSLRSPRLSWRNTTKLQFFSPNNLCSGMSYFAS